MKCQASLLLLFCFMQNFISLLLSGSFCLRDKFCSVSVSFCWLSDTLRLLFFCQSLSLLSAGHLILYKKLYHYQEIESNMAVFNIYACICYFWCTSSFCMEVCFVTSFSFCLESVFSVSFRSGKLMAKYSQLFLLKKAYQFQKYFH